MKKIDKYILKSVIILSLISKIIIYLLYMIVNILYLFFYTLYLHCEYST